MTPPFSALVRLRGTVLRRRFASPLEAVLLAGVCGLSWVGGQELGERLGPGDDLLPAAGATALLALLAAAAAGLARRLLYGARELPLLLAQGLSVPQLVRLRLLELGAFAAVVVLPLAVALAGAGLARGAPASPLLLLGVLTAPPAVAAAALLLAWLATANGPLGRVALAALAAGAAAAAWLAPAAVLGGPAAPGAVLSGLARGEWSALAIGAAEAAGLLLLVDACAPLRLVRGLDAAASRDARDRPSAVWAGLGAPARLLGRRAGALARRDLAILLRGGLPRGVAILLALPAGLLVVRAVQTDPTLEPWHLELIGLFVSGILASGAGYLFGVDLPRARIGQRVLERTHAVRARDALRSRWLPAAAYGGLLAVGVALAAQGGPAAPPGALLAAEGVLLALVVTHDAAAFGLRAEADADPAAATAYPLRAGVLVILIAGAMTALGPLAVLAYPLLGYLGFARSAMRIWELAEVRDDHQAAA